MSDRISRSEKKLPLYDEAVTIGRRRVERGKVRVKTVVRTREELIEQVLRAENLEIQRVAKNIPIGEVPPIRRDGETTIIPLVEEVLVVETRLVLKEEIHIKKRTSVSRVKQPVTLRREEAVIEKSPRHGRAPSGKSVKVRE